jgi:DNA-binding transcriptional MocR family regulator
LREGDQLPTVKEVVGQLAINPNTVLKAYRELEHEGLASCPTTSLTVGSWSPSRNMPTRSACRTCWTIWRYGETPERLSRWNSITCDLTYFYLGN